MKKLVIISKLIQEEDDVRRANTRRVCQNTHFGYSLEGASEWLRCKAPKDEGAGSVLKYMTKPKSDSNAADWLL